MVNGLKDSKNGFTLIEVMAAISLTLMLLLLMSSFIFNTMKCYKSINKVKVEDEYLRQSMFCIRKILRNSSEVTISEKNMKVKSINNEIDIRITKSHNLVAKYSKFNKEEILAKNIEDVSFYKKNNLIYINAKNKNGSEIIWSMPISIL